MCRAPLTPPAPTSTRSSGWWPGRSFGSALDLGCGGGHVSYRLAPHVGQLTAYDLSQAMLDAVGREAAGRGLGNIALRRGAAEALPFADATSTWSSPATAPTTGPTWPPG